MKIFDYLTHIIFNKEVRLADDISVIENDKIHKGAIGEVDDSPAQPRFWINVRDIDNPLQVFADECVIYDLDILTSKEARGAWEFKRISNKKIIDYRIFQESV